MIWATPTSTQPESYADAARDNAQSSIHPERPKEKLRPTVVRTMKWPGSEPFPMWGYTEGPEEATGDFYRTECAIRMLNGFANAGKPWHMEVHYIEPHDPYFPMKRYLDGYDSRAIAAPKSFNDDFAEKPGMHRREAGTWGAVTEEDCPVSVSQSLRIEHHIREHVAAHRRG